MPAALNTNQDSTHYFTAVLRDETGGVLPAASLTTLTLTLYDKATNSIINSRNAQNVLNTAQVTVDSSGNLAWTGQPADNPILNTTRSSERHVALFSWTWNSGAKGAHMPVEIEVNRVKNTPAFPNP